MAQIKVRAGEDTVSKWERICEGFNTNSTAFAVMVESYYQQEFKQEETMKGVMVSQVRAIELAEAGYEIYLDEWKGFLVRVDNLAPEDYRYNIYRTNAKRRTIARNAERWRPSDEEIAEVLGNEQRYNGYQIKIEYSDASLWGDVDPEAEGYDEYESAQAYERNVEAALEREFPGAEVRVVRGINDRLTVEDGEGPDLRVADEVQHELGKVYQDFDAWMVEQSDTDFQYWDHKSSGETFAVCIIDGEPRWINGPLHYTEVEENDPSQYHWDDPFEGDPDDYRLHTGGMR